MTASLCDGPMRFAPKGERSIQEQLATLTPADADCVRHLKAKWEEAMPADQHFSDDTYLRFARCSPGPKKFNEKAAWKLMKRFNRRFLDLTVQDVETQLLTKTLFPVPSLQSHQGHDMFYLRPSRCFPKDTPVDDFIDNVGYCMMTMVEKEKASTEGIGLMAYMNDWQISNFDANFCYHFLMMLQGRVPVRVRLFLIVNPPWFSHIIWKIMKPMLSSDFRKKVQFVSEESMYHFLMEDAEQFVPDEIGSGKASTDAIVQDFVTYRKHVESTRRTERQ